MKLNDKQFAVLKRLYDDPGKRIKYGTGFYEMSPRLGLEPVHMNTVEALRKRGLIRHVRLDERNNINFSELVLTDEGRQYVVDHS